MELFSIKIRCTFQLVSTFMWCLPIVSAGFVIIFVVAFFNHSTRFVALRQAGRLHYPPPRDRGCYASVMPSGTYRQTPLSSFHSARI